MDYFQLVSPMKKHHKTTLVISHHSEENNYWNKITFKKEIVIYLFESKWLNFIQLLPKTRSVLNALLFRPFQYSRPQWTLCKLPKLEDHQWREVCGFLGQFQMWNFNWPPGSDYWSALVGDDDDWPLFVCWLTTCMWFSTKFREKEVNFWK